MLVRRQLHFFVVVENTHIKKQTIHHKWNQTKPIFTNHSNDIGIICVNNRTQINDNVLACSRYRCRVEMDIFFVVSKHSFVYVFVSHKSSYTKIEWMYLIRLLKCIFYHSFVSIRNMGPWARACVRMCILLDDSLYACMKQVLNEPLYGPFINSICSMFIQSLKMIVIKGF